MYLVVILVALLCSGQMAEAQWSEQKINRVTVELQKTMPAWVVSDTIDLMLNAQRAGSYNASRIDDNGVHQIVVVGGETVLLNGMDITGNLGSKTTHGSNSPIIDGGIHNSQVTTGAESPIQKDVVSKRSIYVCFSLSIAFAFSFAFNIALALKLRKSRMLANL